ncbi:aspartate aminotransferase family protein [Acidithiobacillus montserratensis]|uniref:Aspartate aminotransferase family protein n=1 Tax=Acidithiobacillus montserratensis TaxID=2729135 RepID=A0ACD5HDH9_9PROT|nr:aspartate aminotransferase family protein [Acidithiobacillus montserratensis]MBU2747967.1 aspartate aminotransferase family protein [Acidithiobacillus montserratensis]
MNNRAKTCIDPACWLPFTANRDFLQRPRLLQRAKGMYYQTPDGRPILDATAGLWCVNAGHCRSEIIDAITRQVQEMDFAPTFQMGHPLVFQLAQRLIGLMPASLQHVFFTNSGSESADTALKIARAYHHGRGEPQRTLFVGREKAYHGVGFGGLSVGGLPRNKAAFGPLLDSELLPHTLDQEHHRFTRGIPAWGDDPGIALDKIIQKYGSERIAAVIVEPVAGSAGVIVPPQNYLQQLRNACDKNGLLLIFDEVITGFGRLGTPFAAHYFAVTPDILTTAKGLTNAAVPMGAVFVSDNIYQSIMTNAQEGIELFHGYTYSGHPLACAAAMATLDIHEKEGLLTRGREIAPYFENALHSLRDLPLVTDIRNIGMMGAIEMQSLSEHIGARGMAALQKAFDRGLLIRNTADTIALSPPLIISEEEIDIAINIIRETLLSLA